MPTWQIDDLIVGQVKTSTPKRRSGPRRLNSSRQLLRREDWISAAREDLIAAGVGAIKVGQLARRLGVTRGSFYWHFRSHEELLGELLQFWEETNTGSFDRALAQAKAMSGIAEFLAIVNLLLEEKEYSPAFDTAVRDWARIAPKVASAVRRADERRLNVLHRVFLDMGVADPEALVRSRVLYFHQIGYYTLGFFEDPVRRRELHPIYLQVLLGKPLEEITSLLGSGSRPTPGARDRAEHSAADTIAPDAQLIRG